MAVPPIIPGLEFLAPIGSGATASVWRARQSRVGREVAMKLVPFGRPGDGEAEAVRARFRHEVLALGRLSDPHVMKILYDGETDTLGYIVGELVDGASLRSLVAGGRGMPVDEALRCMQGLLRALAHVHAKGVVHRDVKPSNAIRRFADNRVVLVDFGIARLPDSDLTLPEAILGTAHFVSPEQWSGQDIDARTDIYAAGATFYHLLTGRPPYGGAPEYALMQKMRADPPPPSSMAAGVPAAFDRIIAAAMAFNRAFRYATAEEFAGAIARAAGELADATQPQAPPPRRRASPGPAKKPAPARRRSNMWRDLAELFLE
jgi:serine/threonine protein kinase